jgi:DNA-directed RNA polymerase
LKNLENCGVRIVTSSEQAAALHEDGFTSFDGLMDVSDEEAGSIAQVSKNVDLPEPRKRGRPFKATPLIQGKATSEADEDDEDASGEDDADSLLANKFVDLSAVLPPLPKKGDFDVETIKKSEYFFS